MDYIKIKVNLVSRFFTPKNQGVGRIAQDLKDNLSFTYNIKTTKCRSPRTIDYLYYNIFFRFFTIKNSDVYLACSSMESFFLPKDKSIAIVHDLIPILHTLKCATHYNAGVHNVIGSWAFFYLTLMKTTKFKKVICISEETKRDYLEVTKCNPDKVIVIDNWVQEKYTFHQKTKKDSKKIILGTLSVVDSRKRTDVLVKEFMKIKDNNLELHIGGDGSLLQELKQIAKKDKRIKFFGFIPEEDMLQFYENLDVFIFPSSQEGFGIPIIEAMCVGRPVITINNSNIPEKMLRYTTQIDWKDLKQNIYTCNNKSINELKELSDWSCKEFNIHNQMKKYKNVINEVYKSGSR